MFELMYEARGVGLAGNQVGLPYRVFVVNPTGDSACKDEAQVFINPILSGRKGSLEAEEGCLSLPGVFAQVKRPEKVVIDAYDLAGDEVHLELEDLPSRVVQHEADHLDGMLFIDRLTPTGLMAINEALADFESEFTAAQRRGEIPSNAEIALQLVELVRLRT